jgi:hypothetical protein
MNLHYTRYPNVQIQETSLTVHIRNVVKRFVRTGNLDKGKSTEALPGSEKLVITVIEDCVIAHSASAPHCPRLTTMDCAIFEYLEDQGFK